MARSTHDLVSELRRMRPSSDDIERCVDWLRSTGLVSADDALYDAIKDAFALSQQAYRPARVAVYDDIEGRTLEKVLLHPRPR